MHPSRLFRLAAAAILLSALPAAGQYNENAGRNRAECPDEATDPVERSPVPGAREFRAIDHEKDAHGNAAGNQFDLAVDGAFEGQTIGVLHFCLEFDFSLPKAAVEEKGFSVYRWIGAPPGPEELREGLAKCCQLWIVSGTERLLTDAHLEVIKEFFLSGRGLYIWGDNDPYYADANFVAEALFDTSMSGNLPGGQPVGISEGEGKPGILANHLLSTGLESVYEGITIATLRPAPGLKPLIHGSAGNLVAAYWEEDGCRAIFDGGFTRLYCGWETAGTPRYVKNAAAWLANYERFGDR